MNKLNNMSCIILLRHVMKGTYVCSVPGMWDTFFESFALFFSFVGFPF
jgi:hypothetical protein